jgi:uncharacterized protein
MRITVTGATGGIGSILVALLQERGDEVTVLARNPDAAQERLGDVEAHAWDARQPAPAAAIEGRDAIVHLAGEPISQRWTDDAKSRILSSRVDGTRSIVDGIAAAQGDARPLALVAGSAVGYYGHRPDDGDLTESAAPGTGFLAEVCVAWETESLRAQALEVRVAVLRTGTVLANDFGALPVLRRVTKFGLSGPLGSGRQPFPWIHVVDEVGLLLHAIDSTRASGPINAVAPGIVTQAQFARALGRACRRPAIAPAPRFAVRALLGEQAALVLDGARAIPAAARDLGYSFAFPELPSALDDLLGSRDDDAGTNPLNELLG